MRLRATVLAFLLSLCATPASAQIYELWERPRNAVTIPVTSPIAVDIYLPQDELYALEAQGNPMMMGGIAGAIAQGISNKRNDRQTDFAASLQQGLPTIDHAALLQQAFQRHLGPAQLAHISRISTHRAAPTEVEKTTPGDPKEQTLALVVRYYLSPGLRNLRIAMSARLGPRSVVTASPAGQPPSFTQVLIYDVPGVNKEFASEETRRKVWTDMGAAAISHHIQAGMDGVMDMLAYELGAGPRFGRLPGKQIPWSEGLNSSFGIIEFSGAGRNFVRLRNGLLVSLPDDDPRISG